MHKHGSSNYKVVLFEITFACTLHVADIKHSQTHRCSMNKKMNDGILCIMPLI